MRMRELPTKVSPGARRLALAVALGLLAAAPPAWPQGIELNAAPSGKVAPATVPQKDGAVELTLDQAVEIALHQNLGVVLQQYTRTETRLSILQALGIYDLLPSATLTASETQQPVTNRNNPSLSRTQTANLGVSQLFPWGGSASVGVGASRQFVTFTDANLNTLGSLFYTSGLTFNYNQPLLRNFGRLVTERTLLIAQNNSQVSSQEFVRQVTLITQQVINAYWTLVNAREQLVVAQESLGLAKELHERNKIQVQVGTMAPLELVQSEATIATREEGIISAQQGVGDAEDQLRQLLNLPGDLWSHEVRPLTDAKTTHPTINVDQAIATALQARPELHSQELAIQLAQLNSSLAKNSYLPQLDLKLSYGPSGAGPDLSSAFTQVDRLNFPSWTTTLIFSVPLQNRAARAASAIADLDVDRNKVQFDQLRTTVITEVRTAARRVETAAKQIDAATASRV